MTPAVYIAAWVLALHALVQGLLAALWAIRALRARGARHALAAPLPRWAGHAVGADPTVIPVTVQRKER